MRSPDWDELTFEQQVDQVAIQGRVPFGVALRTADDAGVVLPRDGVSAGRLQCHRPWIAKRYFQAAQDAVDADGWFDTGDVAVLHPYGTMQITDRAKDVIKSGGEWISSVDMENATLCHAAVAAIGVHYSKWDERLLLLVVLKPGSSATAADILAHLANRVAKGSLPDEVVFVDDLPHTATGKLLETALRERYRDYRSQSA